MGPSQVLLKEGSRAGLSWNREWRMTDELQGAGLCTKGLGCPSNIRFSGCKEVCTWERLMETGKQPGRKKTYSRRKKLKKND